MTRESQLSSSIRFEEIQLDSEGKAIGAVLREVPVEQLTDKRIASLPFPQRVEKLKAMQEAYTHPYLERQFLFGIANAHPATLQLASTIVDHKDKQDSLSVVKQLRAQAKNNHEKEKLSIRRGEKGRRRIELKVREATASWQRKDQELADDELTQQALNDTVTDIFTKNFLLNKNGIEQFLFATEDLTGQSRFTREDILSLLHHASLRLRAREPHEDASFFSYKDGANNFVTPEEAKTLRNIVTLAFSQPLEDNPMAWQLKQVTTDFLNFYWRNAQSIFGDEEKTPRLALIYDICYAALTVGDFDTSEQSVDYIWRKLENSRVLTRVKTEYEQALRISREAATPITAQIQNDHKLLFPDTTASRFFLMVDMEYLEKWNPIKRRCFLSKYIDRAAGLTLLSGVAESLSSKRPYFGLWNDTLSTQAKEDFTRLADYETSYDLAMFSSFPQASSLSSLCDSFMIRSDYFMLRKFLRRSTEAFENFLNTGQHQKTYESLGAGIDDKWNEVLKPQLLPIILFYGSGIKSYEEMKEAQEKTKAMIRQIRDRNLWFVAENGDQYSFSTNPDLSDHAIESVTFYPNPDSGGYRFDIVTQLIDINGNKVGVSYYIDRDGQFHTHAGKSRLSLWNKIPFEQFILERLHFITSGVLGQKDHLGKGEREVARVVETRRSHWRKLTSTPERIYTLTSESARKHADFVLETYGIDIYQENMRRRAVGTLDQQECITFVKATVRKNSEPNQIVFNPQLLTS